MAAAMTDRNLNSSTVFKLLFSAGNQLHGATSAFLFSADINYPAAPNQTIAEIMSSYWISFAVTGDPNPLRSQNALFWPSYSSGGAGIAADGENVGFSVLSITLSSVGVIADKDASPQCDFFSSQSLVVSN
jgi:hypothetical protein